MQYQSQQPRPAFWIGVALLVVGLFSTLCVFLLFLLPVPETRLSQQENVLVSSVLMLGAVCFLVVPAVVLMVVGRPRRR